MTNQVSRLSQPTSPSLERFNPYAEADLRSRRTFAPRPDRSLAVTQPQGEPVSRVAEQPKGKNTLSVVANILREHKLPMSVRQIVESGRGEIPTRSKTPDTIVARDLSIDIKKKGASSAFIRTSPGRYALRDLVGGSASEAEPGTATT